MIHIGIDPGINGAVAVVSGDYANVWDTPAVATERGREYDVPAMVARIQEIQVDAIDRVPLSAFGVLLEDEPRFNATLEGGRVMPNRIRDKSGEWRDVQQSAKSQAAYWRGIGLWEGILAGLDIPFVVVPPATWKRAMNVPGGGREAKAACVAEARRRFPSAAHLLYRARDDGRAEALLLALYGRIQAEKPRQGVLA
jgi:hypothetical protein